MHPIHVYLIAAYVQTLAAIMACFICLWMGFEHGRHRFSKNRSGSLAVARYVWGIIWHTTVINLLVAVHFVIQGVQFLIPPLPANDRIGNILLRIASSMVLITVVIVFSLLDNPRIGDSNDRLEADYEKDVLKGVKRIIVR